MAATGTGKTSDGAQAIVAAADRDDPRPVWICLWGGANTLAQALIEAARHPHARAGSPSSSPSSASLPSPIRTTPAPGFAANFPISSTSSQPSTPYRRRILLRHLDRHQRRRLLPQRRRRRLYHRHQRVARDQHPQQGPARQAAIRDSCSSWKATRPPTSA